MDFAGGGGGDMDQFREDSGANRATNDLFFYYFFKNKIKCSQN